MSSRVDRPFTNRAQYRLSPVSCTRRIRRGVLVATLLVLSAQFAFAGTITNTVFLNPVADATLFENPPSEPLAGGASGNLYFGTLGQNAGFENLFRRALMRFDIAAAVPAGATIDDVSLTVRVNMVPPDPGGFQTRLYRATSSWNEGPTIAPNGQGAVPAPGSGDVTWQHRVFDTQLWTTEGGDFEPEFSATVLMTDLGSYTWVSGAGPQTLEGDVQAWLDAPSANFGWMIRGVEEQGTRTAKRLSSREASSDPPLLSVTYTVDGVPPPVDPADVPLSGGALVVFLTLLGVGGWWSIRQR